MSMYSWPKARDLSSGLGINSCGGVDGGIDAIMNMGGFSVISGLL